MADKRKTALENCQKYTKGTPEYDTAFKALGMSFAEQNLASFANDPEIQFSEQQLYI